MIEGMEIRGGAGEFEAAVIAVVIDRLAREELEARQGRGGSAGGPGLSAWVRAMQQRRPEEPAEVVWPD